MKNKLRALIVKSRQMGINERALFNCLLLAKKKERKSGMKNKLRPLSFDAVKKLFDKNGSLHCCEKSDVLAKLVCDNFGVPPIPEVQELKNTIKKVKWEQFRNLFYCKSVNLPKIYAQKIHDLILNKFNYVSTVGEWERKIKSPPAQGNKKVSERKK